MKTITSMLFLLLVLLTRSYAAPSVDGVDPRTHTVTKIQWQREAAKTAIESNKNALLLGQAANSKLAKLAFEHYGSIKARNPANAYAALYYGQAGVFYFEESLSSPKFVEKAGGINRIVNDNLAFAVNKLPKSAYAHLAYGYFLWQFYDQMDEGLALVRKARQLDPKAANIAAVLGLMYSNSGGNCYSLEQAERAYRTSVQLDPKRASTRIGFADVLVQRKKYDEAKKQIAAYLSLAPQRAAKGPVVIRIQAQIKQGIGSS